MLTRLLDVTFGRPHGPLGRLGGRIMARGNAEQERQATDQAGLQAGENVVVVGHGPGIGLELAAKAVSPTGHVIGIDPSPAMRDMAAARCATEIKSGVVELRGRTADQTGCADNSMDAAISVNNVMLWNRSAGFAELRRVLRPGGRLVITAHRHVLPVTAAQLSAEAAAAGFTDLTIRERERRFNSPAVELTGRA
ncbi:ubiquinone/menaquinone biosynthesis C-methylase UbiE [Kibdelosporangium banguiense]|uniref:Ubiquinone/menaquinone biosynthesis C-methylase UbiE n=1 Tax=Kibdelosporangium banguiense TaxID=1365924 RepID=A0ABS4TZJ4_9PSEU|nr:methyltransferase domain-containing protein [Kibdelosporangium banguiense]MBP2329820.1 ubiquinone/menaquinone biosynthesis C-methylase UbiE [Kibdelosporangium banguiense]